MNAHIPPARVARFGVFELNARSGELRRHGLKVRLPDQSFQILRLLLTRPGAVVTREELRRALWTSDTFVDFDVGLNSAVRKLREALDDSAENPRFVETLPRRGYRFIASVTLPEEDQSQIAAAPRPMSSAPLGWVVGGLLLVGTVGAFSVVYKRGHDRPASSSAASVGQQGVDPRAYAAYLKGRSAAGLQRYDGYRTAVAYFEEAIARQPDFAAAHSALAQAQFQFLFGGPLSPRETIPKAEAAARRALQLDDTLAQAHLTLGQILTHFYWKWEEADKEFRRAAELHAPSDESFGSVGLSLIRTGRSGEAVAEAELARSRDPLSFAAQVNVGVAYRAGGQYDRAISEFRHALELTPGQPRVHFQMGATYVAMGRINDAIREFETTVQLTQGWNPRFEAYLGYGYAAAGRRHEARDVLEALEARRREQYVSSFGIALIHDALGQKAAALAAIERACDDRAVEFAQMTQYPTFKTIASEPRFLAVMRRVGLPRR
jgi:DNA-binding winged helix-turn-helix (wHTH) protein/tetratricopeptide (TPR) repeat protein